MGKNKQMGGITNIVVGIIGAFLGGWLMSSFSTQGAIGLNLSSLLIAIIGAVVLLFALGLIRR